SVALENIQLYGTLEKKVAERTAELEMANRELESFSYSVSHDLRRPVRAMAGYLDLIGADFGSLLPPDGHTYLRRAQACASEMNSLIDGLLKLAKATRDTLSRATVNLSLVAREIAD